MCASSHEHAQLAVLLHEADEMAVSTEEEAWFHAMLNRLGDYLDEDNGEARH